MDARRQRSEVLQIGDRLLEVVPPVGQRVRLLTFDLIDLMVGA